MSFIQIVDDEPEVLYILGKALSRAGHKVVTCESGRESMESLRATGRPDLILMDIMMPGTDGWNICRKIKDDENYKSIPVIMLSAKERDEDVRKSRSMGGDGHISKSIGIDKLLETINGYIDDPENPRKHWMGQSY